MKKYRSINFNKHPYHFNLGGGFDPECKRCQAKEQKLYETMAKIEKYNSNGYREKAREYQRILKWAWERPINATFNEMVTNMMIEAGLYRPREWWVGDKPCVPREYKRI